jgi:hypothetical protein
LRPEHGGIIVTEVPSAWLSVICSSRLPPGIVCPPSTPLRYFISGGGAPGRQDLLGEVLRRVALGRGEALSRIGRGTGRAAARVAEPRARGQLAPARGGSQTQTIATPEAEVGLGRAGEPPMEAAGPVCLENESAVHVEGGLPNVIRHARPIRHQAAVLDHVAEWIMAKGGRPHDLLLGAGRPERWRPLGFWDRCFAGFSHVRALGLSLRRRSCELEAVGWRGESMTGGRRGARGGRRASPSSVGGHPPHFSSSFNAVRPVWEWSSSPASSWIEIPK